MAAWYNENDPYAADWLENLIRAGHIADGVVDRRSVVDIAASDLAGYSQHHFFAGIGSWSLALRLAGWPDDRPVWTGSCPCQPFSGAGKRRGVADARHLWPDFFRLIEELVPPVVLGEQVASKDGRLWLAGVRADLERVGYEVGAADLCAAGVGAPHIRQRLYWMADAAIPRRGAFPVGSGIANGRTASEPRRLRGTGGLADADNGRREQRDAGDRLSRVADPTGADAGRGFWDAYDALPCIDGKARRVEPGSFPLASGISARVGRLRAYGNAVVPPLAAEFILAVMSEIA